MEVQMPTGQSLPCVRVPISSTNAKLCGRRAHRARNATPLWATRPSRWLLPSSFSAVGKGLVDRPADSCLAHLYAASREVKPAPLFVDSPRTTPDVFSSGRLALPPASEEGPGPFLGGERTVRMKALEVAPERRTVDAEAAGGLAIGGAPPYGLHYLLRAEVYRIGFHSPMMPTAATSPQAL